MSLILGAIVGGSDTSGVGRRNGQALTLVLVATVIVAGLASSGLVMVAYRQMAEGKWVETRTKRSMAADAAILYARKIVGDDVAVASPGSPNHTDQSPAFNGYEHALFLTNISLPVEAVLSASNVAVPQGCAFAMGYLCRTSVYDKAEERRAFANTRGMSGRWGVSENIFAIDDGVFFAQGNGAGTITLDGVSKGDTKYDFDESGVVGIDVLKRSDYGTEGVTEIRVYPASGSILRGTRFPITAVFSIGHGGVIEQITGSGCFAIVSGGGTIEATDWGAWVTADSVGELVVQVSWRGFTAPAVFDIVESEERIKVEIGDGPKEIWFLGREGRRVFPVSGPGI